MSIHHLMCWLLIFDETDFSLSFLLPKVAALFVPDFSIFEFQDIDVCYIRWQKKCSTWCAKNLWQNLRQKNFLTFLSLDQTVEYEYLTKYSMKPKFIFRHHEFPVLVLYKPKCGYLEHTHWKAKAQYFAIYIQ